MDSHSLKVLEYDRVLALIAARTQNVLGRKLVLAMRPMRRYAQICSKHSLYADLFGLQQSTLSLPPLFSEDLSEALQRVSPKDAVLSIEELLLCRGQLDVVQQLCQLCRNPEMQQFETLSALLLRFEPCDVLSRRLHACLKEDGDVPDSASSELQMLRREIRALQKKLQNSLEALLKDPALEDVLQERFVTVRNGRYVLPVRREARSMLPGLVHDQSNSGQTLFLEPASSLNMGNELAGLKLQERDEVRRILAELSAMLRSHLEHFKQNQQNLAELDAAAAITRWALLYDCELPKFGPELKLRQLRHPLLLAQFREEGAQRRVVPLDLELPKHCRCLLITGSNTGGKTVALKAVGLLSLLAQAGLPVPANSESSFVIFDQVFADIGDEQSLQASLSTFSAHISNIARIIKGSAEGRCLVLLDELGSGTDPIEGGAIACGILQELSQGNGLCIATTHLGMVKNFVHGKPNMLNAAVRFNVDSLKPEYALDIGRPGASHAMLIAKRLGLPDSLLENAQSMLSSEQLRLEEVLLKLETQQQALSSRAEEAKRARDQLLRDKKTLQTELDSLRKERKKLMREAYQQAEGLVANSRAELERSIARVRANAPGGNEKNNAAFRQAVRQARDLIADKEEKLQEGMRRSRERPTRPLAAKDLHPGQRVWVEKLQAHGNIQAVSANKQKIDVLVDGISFNVLASDLQGAKTAEAPARPAPVKLNLPRYEGQTSHEINLVGLRVHEALEKLEQYLHDCLLARLQEVRVVHGHGSGRLRDGIRSWLRTQSMVSSYRPGKDHQDIGGTGVTVVTLNTQN
ncbi:MAG: endonuclease MutS2 [Oligosphaeraceae bacterium]|nr:endonuclease MutS2 [Oligosphaeraceae bacterium]